MIKTVFLQKTISTKAFFFSVGSLLFHFSHGINGKFNSQRRRREEKVHFSFKLGAPQHQSDL